MAILLSNYTGHAIFQSSLSNLNSLNYVTIQLSQPLCKRIPIFSAFHAPFYCYYFKSVARTQGPAAWVGMDAEGLTRRSPEEAGAGHTHAQPMGPHGVCARKTWTSRLADLFFKLLLVEMENMTGAPKLRVFTFIKRLSFFVS